MVETSRGTAPSCEVPKTQAPKIRTQLRRSAPRSAFSLVELLVVVAIVGTLASLLLPAIQASREAARRSSCQHRLRQIGLALHQYHGQHRAFPTGCVEWRPPGANRRERHLAWSVYLLPHLEEHALFARLDLSKAFDDPHNAAWSSTEVLAYRCPSSRRETVPQAPGASDYGGIYGERIVSFNYPPQGVMLHDQAIALAEITDGSSFTLVVAEDTRHPDGQWINGRNLFDQAFGINAAPPFENDIWSDHPEGAHGLAADGSVHFMASELDWLVLAALCTRAGGETHARWQP